VWRVWQLRSLLTWLLLLRLQLRQHEPASSKASVLTLTYTQDALFFYTDRATVPACTCGTIGPFHTLLWFQI
jgi:hypothetical protein